MLEIIGTFRDFREIVIKKFDDLSFDEALKFAINSQKENRDSFMRIWIKNVSVLDKFFGAERQLILDCISKMNKLGILINEDNFYKELCDFVIKEHSDGVIPWVDPDTIGSMLSIVKDELSKSQIKELILHKAENQKMQ